ncbi:cytochrome c [Paenibacillus alginolyticus]|uniref:c-type cytochrome n=1 Tax=Paenibacillus alginolyticus TaxID=59839 RepID=UPI0006887D50|nr:cytochrome c [Paenibacillus alginolyticus]MCY9670613.1 cytochrome c [Paenibacillus alginolyticus]
MMNKRLFFSICYLLLTGLISGCGSNTRPADQNEKQVASSSTLTTASSAGSVETIYKSNCMSCHGINLEGKIGPSLKNVAETRSHDQIATKIQNGGGGMPAFKSKLQDQDVQELANWLATKK